MKKISILIVTAILVFTLCACDGGEKAYESSTATDITNSQLQDLIQEAEKAQAEKNS